MDHSAKDVSQRLVERWPDIYAKYLRKDGGILMEMFKLTYGYQEASHYFGLLFAKVFTDNGFEQHHKHKCVLYQRANPQGRIEAVTALTVDDAYGAATPEMKSRILKLCRDAFKEITLEEGDNINVIGMNIQLDRIKGTVKIQQKRFVEKLLADRGVTKAAPTPCTMDFFKEPPNSPLLLDQRDFMSLNSSLMYAGKRTYPEILPAVTMLARKYGKATELDLKKATRVVQYLNYHSDHSLYLRPMSLNIVASGDASYSEHEDAKSHTGGCIGFEGFNGHHAYLSFISSKQSLVTKSSTEAELVAADTVVSTAVWMRQFMEELGVRQRPIRLDQDNQSTIIIAGQGTGTFKRSKHIKVRYFWIKEQIDDGVLEISHVPGEQLVADILTKPLSRERFNYLLHKLLGWNALEE